MWEEQEEEEEENEAKAFFTITHTLNREGAGEQGRRQRRQRLVKSVKVVCAGGQQGVKQS